jgi:hypothetical protein
MSMLEAYAILTETGKQSERVNVLIEAGHKNVGQAIDHVRAMIGNAGARLRIKTCGTGGKADNPILQAADMLAYCEWRQMAQSGREIFDVLNLNGRPYRTYRFDANELVGPIARGVNEFEALCKANQHRYPVH